MKGVDFGTTTSLVAEAKSAGSAVVPLGTRDPWLPSIVGLEGDNWFTCEDASRLNEDQILRSVKRAITRNKGSFQVSNGEEIVTVDADDAIRKILSALVAKSSEAFVNLMDDDVRLGCPAMWVGHQRQRLIRLANQAGLSVGEGTVIDEPIAAGVAWMSNLLEAKVELNGKVIVFDMGGGTLDVAILHVVAAQHSDFSISVESAVGIDQAGDLLDQSLADLLIEKFERQGINLNEHPRFTQIRGWIQSAAKQAKVELSAVDSTTVVVNTEIIDLPVLTVTRVELERVFQAQLDEAFDTVWWALRAAVMAEVVSPQVQAGVRPSEAIRRTEQELAKGVDYVLLAGGMAQVPAVRKKFEEAFPGKPIWVGSEQAGSKVSGNSALMIAQGLAYQNVYERMNLHRPAFDFVLEWRDNKTGEWLEQVIYPAFSPLYDSQTIIATDSAKYRWHPKAGSLPTSGEGMIRVRSMSGQSLGFRSSDEKTQFDADGIKFRFGTSESQAVVTLEPNGRIFWRDSMGYSESLRIKQWPVINLAAGIPWIIYEAPQNESHLDVLVWHQRPYD